MEDARRQTVLCPSARCEPGATVIGVVGADGKVGYVRPRVEIDEDFVKRARGGRTPERRFRFAQPCVESGCRHWTGARCGVIDAAINLDPPPAAELPRCSIRAQCRWFSQSGVPACRVCPLVVTRVGPAEVDE
jgi:hypothetical protein